MVTKSICVDTEEQVIALPTVVLAPNLLQFILN